MEDDVAAAHSGMGTLIALNVTLDELDFLDKRQEILASTGREVV
jgi:hypothetical protein